MQEFEGKTAVITGGAGGIGLSLAHTLGNAGMNVVITDIDPDALSNAAQSLEQANIPTLAVPMDVADRDQWQHTATRVTERFGNVHMLINNAGVSGGVGTLDNFDEAGWRWTVDVNLMGVVYGGYTFVPLMKQHGEQAWLVNVASMAGMGGVPMAGAYTATKAAVVALSEAWAEELGPQNIHVSVLAPAFVRTRIHQSQRNRQERYASDVPVTDDQRQVLAVTTEAVNNGIDTELVGQRLLEALVARELYVFTHPNYHKVTAQRSAAIAEAFERAAESPHLQQIKDQRIRNFTDN